MTFTALVECLKALTDAGVRYLVVGGFAVAAHGHRRSTVDLDLVIGLEAANIRLALETLALAGFHPKVPVTPAQFADPALRQQWIDEKNMIVFQLWHERHHGMTVDVFVKEPFDFGLEYERAIADELIPGLTVRYPALDTLIQMKLGAGRDKDLQDVEALKRIHQL